MNQDLLLFFADFQYLFGKTLAINQNLYGLFNSHCSMKYLVDVNISKPDKFLEEHPEYENVKYKINGTVEDQEIMKIAQKDDYILYTQDKRFALVALIAGLKVVYREQETGKEFRISSKLNEF